MMLALPNGGQFEGLVLPLLEIIDFLTRAAFVCHPEPATRRRGRVASGGTT